MMNSSPLVQFIKTEFQVRKNKNKSYSLRKFSMDMGISVSIMSRIMNEKVAISEKTLRIINKKIQVPQQFFEDVKKVKENKTHWRHEKIKYLVEEDISLMKSWYFPVVWEVVTQPQFNGDFSRLAAGIGITNEEVLSCFAVLKQHGLIRPNDLGGWVTDHQQASTVHLNYSTEELRRLQIQLFMQQIRFINELPLDIRDHSTIFISGGSEVVDEVKKRIKLFRRSLANYIEKSDKESPTQVYQLSIGFSPCLKK